MGAGIVFILSLLWVCLTPRRATRQKAECAQEEAQREVLASLSQVKAKAICRCHEQADVLYTIPV